jgi:hypothetical protein
MCKLGSCALVSQDWVQGPGSQEALYYNALVALLREGPGMQGLRRCVKGAPQTVYVHAYEHAYP